MRLTRNELILLAILSLGLFLRIYDLASESLWFDEGYSIRVAHLNLPQIVEDCSQDAHPPLYYIILHYWINLFGDSEFSTRFLSVIFGFFAIFMIYKVGSLIFDKEVGILSSLILGLSVFHIHYSQEVRMYSLVSLLTLLSIYFFIKLLEKRSLIVSTGYILSSILLIYTHAYGLFIIMGQNIYLVALFLLSKGVYKLNFGRWILLQAILVALFAPWIRTLIGRISEVQNGWWLPVPSTLTIIHTFFIYSGRSALLLFLFIILSYITIITIFPISLTILKVFYEKPNPNKIYLLLAWLLTTIALPFIISQFSQPVYRYRCTIGASLAFYLLVAYGIRNIKYTYAKLVIITIVIVFSLVNVWGYYTEVNKEQWRNVANYIDTNAQPGDLLLFSPGYCQKNVFDYYSKRTDLIKKPFIQGTFMDVVGRKVSVDELTKELKLNVEGYNRVWVVVWQGFDRKGLIKKTLSESYNLLYDKKYVGPVTVQLFEKK